MKNLILSLFFIIPILFVASISSESSSYAAAPTKIEEKQDCTYWITKSSHKRHNSNCRYYKNSKGYCTDDKSDGTACKICGG